MADATLLVLQHVACEPPATCEDEMLRWGVGLHRVQVDEGEPLPDWRAFDGIVAMGGPMGAHDVGAIVRRSTRRCVVIRRTGRKASRSAATAPYDRAMPRTRRLRLLAAGAFLLLLIVPALALAKVKRGTYIEVKTQTYIATNAAATKIKSLNIPCIYNGQPYGANLITKSLKISEGKFSFDGKSTLRGVGTTSVINVKVTGKFGNGKITGKVTYLAPAPCTTRSYSAKYYGVNPQG